MPPTQSYCCRYRMDTPLGIAVGGVVEVVEVFGGICHRRQQLSHDAVLVAGASLSHRRCAADDASLSRHQG